MSTRSASGPRSTSRTSASPSRWPASSASALPIAGLAAQFENGLVARGFGDEDMSNLARVIREMSALD